MITVLYDRTDSSFQIPIRYGTLKLFKQALANEELDILM